MQKRICKNRKTKWKQKDFQKMTPALFAQTVQSRCFPWKAPQETIARFVFVHCTWMKIRETELTSAEALWTL
jgi:hypothetical protein